MLNVISGRLGLDHDRVLGGRYAFPIMSRYVVQNSGKLATATERDKLLYWYVQSFIWGRYAGSTESKLNQDLAAMEENGEGLDGLIEQLRIWRGDLVVRPENFAGYSRGARFYPMLYLLTRVGEARDWGNGLPLKANLLGKLNRLQLHHIFPKSQLYAHDYDRSQVNSLANFCFLTQDTNLAISNDLPEIYFSEVESAHPDALASQWIPMDPYLWKIENYLDFLRERQKLLARAANEFLDTMLSGTMPEMEFAAAPEDAHVAEKTKVPGGINGKDEEDLLLETNLWVEEQGLPPGDMLYELTDEESNESLAVLDLAWPTGIQVGLSDPVALLIGEDTDTLEIASQAGYRCFTEVDDFRTYVKRDILALEPA
jgi:hypothetical protein